MLVSGLREKPGYPGKNLSEQSREPTNSTHIWRPIRESNPGHIGGRPVLSPLLPNIYIYIYFVFVPHPIILSFWESWRDWNVLHFKTHCIVKINFGSSLRLSDLCATVCVSLLVLCSSYLDLPSHYNSTFDSAALKISKVCATFKQYLLLQLSLRAELMSQYNGKWSISLAYVQNRL